MTLDEKLKAFYEARNTVNALEAQLDEAKRALNDINIEITDEFIDKEIQNMTVNGIGRFSLRVTEIPKIEDEVACKTWLRDKGDLENVLAFHAGKFRSYYKNLVEVGEELPPGVDVFIKKEVRLTQGG